MTDGIGEGTAVLFWIDESMGVTTAVCSQAATNIRKTSSQPARHKRFISIRLPQTAICGYSPRTHSQFGSLPDDALIRDLIVYRLQNHHFDVVAARDGKEGVLLAQSENPDLILMDIRMPIMDGWEATEQIKTSPQTAAIPIIALTAQSAITVNQRGMPVSYDGYAQKPLEFKRLLTQIKSLIQQRIVA